jgi:hypothetical protein
MAGRLCASSLDHQLMTHVMLILSGARKHCGRPAGVRCCHVYRGAYCAGSRLETRALHLIANGRGNVCMHSLFLTDQRIPRMQIEIVVPGGVRCQQGARVSHRRHGFRTQRDRHSIHSRIPDLLGAVECQG